MAATCWGVTKGEVLGRSNGTRLYVRFDDEHAPVSIRPHLLRVLPRVLTIGQIIAQLEELQALVSAEDRG